MSLLKDILRKDAPPPHAPGPSPDTSDAPPAYAEAEEDIITTFSNLNLNNPDTSLPSPDRIIAHLKLLEAFHQLREVIALQARGEISLRRLWITVAVQGS